MSISIQVKTQEDKEIQLSIDGNKLIIEGDESISLEHIYNVQEQPDGILQINAIIQEKPAEEDSSQPKSLTNIRPKELSWTRQTFSYHKSKEDVSEFVSQLQKLTIPLRSQFPSTKIYCVLNPTSGKRLAESQWKEIVQPMLITAGFNVSNLLKITTESNGKTRNIAKSVGENILKQDHEYPPIVITMGGDGTLHEVVNGLSDALGGSGHFRLGVLPSGSGNAFALGLNIDSVEQGTLKIIQAKEEKPFYYMDIKFGRSSSENWYENIEYDELKLPLRLLVVFSWGFHAQIVSKSRYLRYFMGNTRFSLVAKFLLTFLQQYEGELVLKDAKKYNYETEAFDDKQDTVVLGQEKKFTYFIASKQHSLEKGFKIAPFASILDEYMDVVILRDATSESLVNASINAFQGGVHVKSSDVEYFKANELYLRVKNKTELCLDGEIHDIPANGIIQLKVVESSTDQSSFTIFI